jgi:hypothetical protein
MKTRNGKGGNRMSRLSWAIILGFGGLALANPAQAQTANTAYAVGYPAPYNAPNSVTLQPIHVLASVGGRCGYAAGNAPNGSVNAPSFDILGFDQSFNFVLDCTGAFRVGVVSLNGGLLTGGAVPSGYGVKAPYDVQLNLRNDANTITATSACQAAELLASNNAASCSAQYLAGGTNFSGPASVTRGLRVNGAATSLTTNQTIRVKANAYAGPDILTAGTYTDTLTVTVSVAP